jgi:hypothetical protein
MLLDYKHVKCNIKFHIEKSNTWSYFYMSGQQCVIIIRLRNRRWELRRSVSTTVINEPWSFTPITRKLLSVSFYFQFYVMLEVNCFKIITTSVVITPTPTSQNATNLDYICICQKSTNKYLTFYERLINLESYFHTDLLRSEYSLQTLHRMIPRERTRLFWYLQCFECSLGEQIVRLHIPTWALKFLVWRIDCMLGLIEFLIENQLILNAVNIMDAK